MVSSGRIFTGRMKDLDDYFYVRERMVMACVWLMGSETGTRWH